MPEKKNTLENYEIQFSGIIFVFWSYNYGIILPNPSSEISLINFVDPTFILKSMKKLFLFLAIGAFIAFAFSSCAATKRDCQGNKHYKQKGGFYM